MTSNYLINYFKDYNVSVVVLRLFLIYGESQNIPRLVPLLKNNINNNKIFYANSLTQKKDFCHVSDLYKSLLKILKHKKITKDIYNFGSGHITNIKYVLKVIEKSLIKKLELK